VKVALVTALIAVCACVAASPGGAADECHGLQVCIPVHGPWVVAHKNTETPFLLSCGSHGVIGGLDAVATASAVRVGFDGRIGAPVQPGVTTTGSAVFRGTIAGNAIGAFQPWLGCVPASGGGGRSTVSAQTKSGPALDPHARLLIVEPGAVKTLSVACLEGEQLVGGWAALAFRTAKPPPLADVGKVHVTRVIAGRRVHITVSATDGLSINDHAIVQVGAECAP
jgi:hypothetical protein